MGNSNLVSKKEKVGDNRDYHISYANRSSNSGGKKGLYLMKYIYESFHNDLTINKTRILILYFSLISVIEVLAYQLQGFFSVIASRCWLIAGAVCLTGIVICFIKTIYLEVKAKHYLSVIAVALLIVIFCALPGNINIADINPDAAQQAAAGLASFKVDDLNYTGKAFLGYPNRQYLLTALPALILGRSILSLHLGFAIPFILGIILLYSALCRWTHRLQISTELAVLPLYALLVFRFVTEYYINFEQAIYPISFTMLGIGFFLHFLCKPSMFHSVGLAWIGCLFSNSYTPALASLGLMIFFLTISVFGYLRNPKEMPFPVKSPRLSATVLLSININIMVFLLATMVGQRQDKLSETRSVVGLRKLISDSILNYLTDKNAVFLGMFGIIVIIYLIAGLTFCLRVRDFFISLWILGVFVASDILTGYTSYDPAWIMQRALIVIPVLVTAVTLTIFEVIKRYKIKLRRSILAVILISFAFIGINNFKQVNQSFTYFNYIQPMKYMWKDLENTVKDRGLDAASEFNLVLYTDSILMKNPTDYCMFLYPNAKVYTPDAGIIPEEIDFNLDTIVYGDAALPQDLPLVSKEVKTFEDKKYELTVTWFKGETSIR